MRESETLGRFQLPPPGFLDLYRLSVGGRATVGDLLESGSEPLVIPRKSYRWRSRWGCHPPGVTLAVVLKRFQGSGTLCLAVSYGDFVGKEID